MDTSETYIKMCEKAEEIQAGFQTKEITAYRFTNGQIVNIDGNYLAPVFDFTNGSHYIWLPRQDQLQEMLLNSSHQLTPLIGALYKWLKDNNYDQYFGNVTSNPFFSMEQLWLAFVMKENQGKVWDGEKWNIVKDVYIPPILNPI